MNKIIKKYLTFISKYFMIYNITGVKMKIRLWNSTLKADVSKGLKRKTPLRQMSAKTRKRISDYRQKAFAEYGHRCFLCGRYDATGKTLDVHHPFGRINGDACVVPLCNRFSGCRAHNHNGMDARFHELQREILEKMNKNGETK